MQQSVETDAKCNIQQCWKLLDRRVTPPKRVTSPTRGPPPPCKTRFKVVFSLFFCAQYWYPCSIRTPEQYRQLCESLKGVFWMFNAVILCFSSPLPSQRPRLNGHNFFGQRLLTLLDDTSCICLYTLLHVVACCWELLSKVWNRSILRANNYQHFIFSVRRNNIGSVCTAPPTLLKPRARITHSLFLLQLKRAQVPSDDLVAYYCACIRSSLDYACPVLYYMHLQSICKPNLRELKREPSRVSSLGFPTRTL